MCGWPCSGGYISHILYCKGCPVIHIVPVEDRTCSLGSFRRQCAAINFTKRDLLSQNVTSQRQTFLNCKLVLYIYINTINFNTGGQMCHIYVTQPGSVCPAVVNSSSRCPLRDVLYLLSFCRKQPPTLQIPWPSKPQTQPVLPALHVGGLNTQGTRLFPECSIIPGCAAQE